MTARADRITRVTVDLDGLRVLGGEDAVLDVLFDGRRVWSFWTHRDGRRADDPDTEEWLVAWPRPLLRFLDGHAHVTVRYHGGADLYAAGTSFGTAKEQIAIVDRDGHPLGIDNAGRLVKTFETRDPRHAEPVLDAMETVLAALADAGVAAFPAYGTLLGAVREGGFISHDSDADLGYLSAHSHPVDVIRESFRLQRRLHAQGFEITRYSGAAFKVDVVEPDGFRRGLDVFAGFFYDGNLVMMGEIFTPYRREWMLPLGTVRMEGRSLPAPAAPERLLTVMYGPSWRVPDPGFVFRTPESTTRRLNEWFRGTRAFRSGWDRTYALARYGGPSWKAHELARVAHRQEPPDAFVVDLGCGRGQDACWLARRGRTTWGLDYSAVAFAWMDQTARAQGWPVTMRAMNLLELRQALAWGARFAALPGPRAVLARHLVDATTEQGRRHLWRLVRMALAGGGRLYLEFLTGLTGELAAGTPLLHPVPADRVEAEAAAAGGTVRDRRQVEPFVVDLGHGPRQHEGVELEACRMVVEWAS